MRSFLWTFLISIAGALVKRNQMLSGPSTYVGRTAA